MAGVAFCVALGFGVVAPAIPLFAEQFGVSAGAAGAVVSAFALMRLLSGIGAGRMVDLLGVRTCLMIGLAAVGVSSLLAGLAQSYSQLLILRGIGGVGSAVFGVAAISVVLQVASSQNRGRAMSIYRSGFITGGIAGPAVGGAVLGISLRAPFFLYAGTLALSGLVAMLFLAKPARPATGSVDLTKRETSDVEEEGVVDGALMAETDPAATAVPVDDKPAETPPSLRDALRTREYQAALTSNLAIGLAIFGLRSTIVPLLIHDKIGASDSWVAWAFLVSAIVETALMFPAGRWSDRSGRRFPLVVGAFVSAGAMVLLGISGSLLLVMIAMVVFGAGSATLGTVPGALVGDVVGGRGGVAIAIFNMASDLGSVVGPVLAGWLVDQGSYGAAFGLGAVVIAAAGLAGLRLPAHAAARATA